MEMYINGIGTISPQSLSGEIEILTAQGQKFLAVEPDYAQWIDPRLLRRMSRIVSMGVTAAFMALKDAGIEMPDAITTGTGFGCLDDTGTFLTKMVKQNEEGVNPTPFIQSTHNTIGSQVALLLGCHGHNQTFTHQSFSLESALLDAKMLLAENPNQNILVGAVDEITEVAHTLMQRAGIFGDDVAQGEGAFYFLCSSGKKTGSYAKVVGQCTSFKPKSIQDKIEFFLKDNHIDRNQIDLVLYGGMNQLWDSQADATVKALFERDQIIAYKKYCGEFATSAGFAIGMGALVLRDGVTLPQSATSKPKNILIYNPYLGHHHSLILLQSCHGTK